MQSSPCYAERTVSLSKLEIVKTLASSTLRHLRWIISLTVVLRVFCVGQNDVVRVCPTSSTHMLEPKVSLCDRRRLDYCSNCTYLNTFNTTQPGQARRFPSHGTGHDANKQCLCQNHLSHLRACWKTCNSIFTRERLPCALQDNCSRSGGTP